MEIITKPAFRLVGLQLDKETTNENGQSSIDCGNLWQKFEQSLIAEKISGKVDDTLYAVYFDYEGDHTKPFSYFIGCKVSPNEPVPEGLSSLEIPEQKYSPIIAKGQMPDCIANSWKNIWASDMNRTYNYDLEIYDERSKNWSNAEVEILVSVG